MVARAQTTDNEDFVTVNIVNIGNSSELITATSMSWQRGKILWGRSKESKKESDTDALPLRALTPAADRLCPSFAIHVAVPNAPKDHLDAADRTRFLIFSDRLGCLIARCGADNLPAVRRAKALSGLTFRLLGSTSGAPRPIATEAMTPLGTRSEAYSLVVPANGSAAVPSANSRLGFFRSFTGSVKHPGVPVAISCSPGYPYSGFMLDIKRTLDALSWFIPENVANIVSYAGTCRIGVLSVCSHSNRGCCSVLNISSCRRLSRPDISKAHPEHIACFKATSWATYANLAPVGQLRLASPAIVNFTIGLLNATLVRTGSDEINSWHYQGNAQTQQEPGGRLWVLPDDADTVAAKGFRFIHVASNSFYLDCGAGNSWCEPFKAWQNVQYAPPSDTFDPLANLTAALVPLVPLLCLVLWTEQSGLQNLDSIVWPRPAAGHGGNVSAALPHLHELGYRLRNRGLRAIALQSVWCALRSFACDLMA
ncbi:N-acetylhexosaminidase [Lactarius sanguifluus]|nr:N-acetylhexosaminidase [Lactarius sanguifluus]